MIAFWFCVLVGVGFAVWGVRRQFFGMWGLLFNIAVAIYVGMLLTPTILGAFPDLQKSGYNVLPIMLLLGAVVFGILQLITTQFLTGKFEVAFPELFDKIGGGVLGFLAGYLVACYLVFMICTTPISTHQSVKTHLGKAGPIPTCAAPLKVACRFIGNLSLQVYDNAPEAADYLVTGEHQKLKRKGRPSHAEDQPVWESPKDLFFEPNEPNELLQRGR